jgi:hypothetical protein
MCEIRNRIYVVFVSRQNENDVEVSFFQHLVAVRKFPFSACSVGCEVNRVQVGESFLDSPFLAAMIESILADVRECCDLVQV